MTPEQWRKLGFSVDRKQRPLSRGVRYVVYKQDGGVFGIAYSRRELDDLLEGRSPTIAVTMPGPKAAGVRPARRYL